MTAKAKKSASTKQYVTQTPLGTVQPVPTTSIGGYVFSNNLYNTKEYETAGNSIYETEFFTIDFMMENNSSGYLRSQVFYSEEELVFSFIKIYNALLKEEKFVATTHSVIELSYIKTMSVKSTINGVVSLISPIYLLEKAKEFKYE